MYFVILLNIKSSRLEDVVGKSVLMLEASIGLLFGIREVLRVGCLGFWGVGAGYGVHSAFINFAEIDLRKRV